jgi:hypothetical protein
MLGVQRFSFSFSFFFLKKLYYLSLGDSRTLIRNNNCPKPGTQIFLIFFLKKQKSYSLNNHSSKLPKSLQQFCAIGVGGA